MASPLERSTELNTRLLLKYSGPSVDEGSMNVYDLAANLVAFSDFVVVASHTVFGPDVEVKADVRAFQKGSFVTDVMFHVAGPLAAVWQAVPDISKLTTTLKQSLELYKFLKGKAPSKVEHRNDRSVAVHNNNGQVTVVNIDSLTLAMSDKAGESVGGFIAKALQQGKGVNKVSIDSDGEPIASASEADAQYFGKVEAVAPVNDTTSRLHLMIETASFKDGNKWKFSDGSSSQLIAIADENFLKRVDEGEPFRKGDILVVDVRITQHQTYSGAPVKTEKVIVKVIEHQRRGGDQLPLIESDNG